MAHGVAVSCGSSRGGCKRACVADDDVAGAGAAVTEENMATAMLLNRAIPVDNQTSNKKHHS